MSAVMPMKRHVPATARQIEALEAIAWCIREYGRPPTCRELGVCMGIDGHAAFLHIRALRRKGALERDGEQARALRVTAIGLALLPAPAPTVTRCPVCSEPASFIYRCLGCETQGCRACARCACPAFAEDDTNHPRATRAGDDSNTAPNTTTRTRTA